MKSRVGAESYAHNPSLSCDRVGAGNGGAGSAGALHQNIKRGGGGMHLRNEDGRVRPRGWTLGELLPKNLHGYLPKGVDMLESVGRRGG